MKRIISYLLLVVFVCMYVGSLLPVNAYSASNAEAVANAFMQTYSLEQMHGTHRMK